MSDGWAIGHLSYTMAGTVGNVAVAARHIHGGASSAASSSSARPIKCPTPCMSCGSTSSSSYSFSSSPLRAYCSSRDFIHRRSLAADRVTRRAFRVAAISIFISRSLSRTNSGSGHQFDVPSRAVTTRGNQISYVNTIRGEMRTLGARSIGWEWCQCTSRSRLPTAATCHDLRACAPGVLGTGRFLKIGHVSSHPGLLGENSEQPRFSLAAGASSSISPLCCRYSGAVLSRSSPSAPSSSSLSSSLKCRRDGKSLRSRSRFRGLTVRPPAGDYGRKYRDPNHGGRDRVHVCRAMADGGNNLAGTRMFGARTRIETDGIPAAVRDATMRAVDEFGRKVTVGDVASRAGLKLSEAEMALRALAADANGFLEVSNAGDVLYGFPSDYRSVLYAKSLSLKLEPIFSKIKEAGVYLVRVTFGTALLASIALVYTSIFVVLNSKSDSDSQSSNRGGFGGMDRRVRGPSFYVSPFDVLWYLDPYSYRRRRTRRREADGSLNFFEAVFSFVFGDGDPNEGLDEKRWKQVGEFIALKGGVVTAEELAPLLDPPPLQKDGSPVNEDESFVLPALLRFDGSPEVDEQGNLLYRFPALQRTAEEGRDWRRAKIDAGVSTEYFQENRWDFSGASSLQQALAIGLGAANLVGVVIIGSMLRNPSTVMQIGAGGSLSGGLIPFVSQVLPFLQVYAATFFAIPAIRWLSLKRRNSEIDKNNNVRLSWAVALGRQNARLRRKISNARQLAQRITIDKDQIVYSTEKDVAEQDVEAVEWEQRLRERERATD